MLEAATEDESGGNSRFAGGVMRFAYASVEDLQRVTDITDEEIAEQRLRHQHARGVLRRPLPADELPHRSGPLARSLVTKSLDDDGVAALARARASCLNYGRQSGIVNGKRKFFGRMPIEVNGGGAGLVQYLDAAAKKAGIEIFYETRATSLIYDGERVPGVRAQQQGQAGRVPREGGGARLRRLRGESRDAHALPRARAGSSPRCAARASTWRRPEDGARHRRRALRQLVGLPRDRLGPLRAGVRRRQRRRPVPEAQLHLRPPDQLRAASASSTKAGTSTRSPTPSTAARC